MSDSVSKNHECRRICGVACRFPLVLPWDVLLMFTANQYVALNIERNIEHVVKRVETREEVRARLYKVAYNPEQSRGKASHKAIEKPYVHDRSIYDLAANSIQGERESGCW